MFELPGVYCTINCQAAADHQHCHKFIDARVFSNSSLNLKFRDGIILLCDSPLTTIVCILARSPFEGKSALGSRLVF